MGPGLTIDIAEKRYGGVEVFKDFRLSVEPSSIVALVGPSGVGKSTLLRMIAGIDNRYSGSIRVGDADARRAAPAGFVFQDARLLPWLTSVQNITVASPATSAERARELIASVGLADYEDSFPHELSGGMQRRLALVRAASVNTGFWLFDEPFVSLDQRLASDLQHQFMELAVRHAPTVVTVTHQPAEAARLATRAVALAGRPARIVADLAFDDRPEERSAAELHRLTELLGRRMAGET